MENKRKYCAPLPESHPDAWDFPFLCADDYDRLPLSEVGPFVSVNAPNGKSLRPNPYFNNIEVIGSYKEYLMSHFYLEYTSYLRRMIEQGSVAVGKSSFQIPQPERICVNTAEVERIDLFRKSANEVYADIIISVELTLYDHLGNQAISDVLSQWYRLRTFSDLSPDNSSFNSLEFIAVYDRSTYPPGRALDDYLVPYTAASLLDSEGTGILALYYPEALESPCRIDGEELAKRMNLHVKYCRLSKDCSIRGQMYFEDRTIEVLDRLGRVCHKKIPANTIIVDISSCIDDDMNLKKEQVNDTLIHECR